MPIKKFDEEMFISNSVNKTAAIAKDFADVLEKGDCVLMIGDLGAGKTTFTKALVAGLGIPEIVRSPSFTLMNEYKNDGLKVYHFDFYRVNDISEIETIGWDEYILGDGISIVEWAERVKDVWPDVRWEVYFEYVDEKKRKISFKRIK